MACQRDVRDQVQAEKTEKVMKDIENRCLTLMLTKDQDTHLAH